MRLLFVLIALFCNCTFLIANPLLNYIEKQDGHFHWHVNADETQVFNNYTYYTLTMTSQQWQSLDEVNHPIWSHQLRVIVPNTVTADLVLVHIVGGTLNKPQNSIREELVECALNNESIVAEITTIPNQSLTFDKEMDDRYKTTGRQEDSIIAYTWQQFFTTRDNEWPLQLPMTKSVVKGMDCIEEFCEQLQLPIPKGFVLSGRSKRGWVAWTTAVVDQRVKGVIPIVIDLLNLKEAFVRHYDAYGFWSPALKDYLDLDIMSYRHTDVFEELMDIIEPFRYKEALLMPKYIINSTGDQFFLPDSSQLYFHELQGEKYLRYIANADHALTNTHFLDSVNLFYSSILHNQPLPKFSWYLDNNNQLQINIEKGVVKEINLWSATNPKARDFRVTSIGKCWKKTTLEPDTKITLLEPQEGWTAYFVEVIFDNAPQQSHIFTTDVFILPDSFPYSLESISIS